MLAAEIVSPPIIRAAGVFPRCASSSLSSRTLLSYLEAIDRAQFAAHRGVLVNVGARWSTAGYDHDVAWDLAIARPFVVVAFEADATNFRILQRRVDNHLPSTSRATLLNERAQSSTIASRLASHGVLPGPSFALLKIDIDSTDLAIAEAIVTSGMRPSLIVAEYNHFTPWPLRFAALEASSREHARYGAAWGGPRYQGEYSGSNGIWPCMGASLAMWVAWGTRHGYDLLTTDRISNVVLVESGVRRGSALRNLSTSALACGHAASTYKQNRLHAGLSPSSGGGPHLPLELGRALEHVDRQCTRSETPYIAEIDDLCCPNYPVENKSITFRDRRGREGRAVQTQRLSALCRCAILQT